MKKLITLALLITVSFFSGYRFKSYVNHKKENSVSKIDPIITNNYDLLIESCDKSKVAYKKKDKPMVIVDTMATINALIAVIKEQHQMDSIVNAEAKKGIKYRSEESTESKL